MALRSLTTVPPGGWRLEQKLADGTIRKFHSMGLVWEFAEQVADFRKGNGLPNATPKEVVHEIETQTCERLHGDREWCVDDEAKKKGLRPAFDRLSKSANLAVGAKTLIEWLGDGASAVSIPIAQARANVCITCDRNKLGHRWMKFTGDLVKVIAEQVRAKEAQKLHVENEDKLGICSECDCVNSLKIWLKPNILAERTSQETLDRLPAWCWLKTELTSNGN